MKQILAALFSIGALTILFSCANECKKLDCGTNGSCMPEEEACVCNIGYEKDGDGKCTVISGDKFVGFWTGTLIRNDTISIPNYTLTIDTVTKKPIQGQGQSTQVERDVASVRLYNMGVWKCDGGPSSVLAKVAYTYNANTYELIDFKLNIDNCMDGDSLDLLSSTARIEDGRLKMNYKFKYIDVDSVVKFSTFSADLIKQ